MIRLPIPLILILIILMGCKREKAHTVDLSSDPKKAARELTENYSPEEAACMVVDWMSKASQDEREYARNLTSEILSIYDSTGNDLSRRFIYSMDNAKESLSLEKLARVYVIASGPWRLGVLLREGNVSGKLIEAIEKEYSNDSISLEYFRKAYNLENNEIN